MSQPPELGNLLKGYGLSRARVRQLLGLMSISVAMALLFWLPAIFDPHADLVTRIGVFVVGLFCASPAAVGVYEVVRLSGISLALYENGLVYRRRGVQHATTWDDIDTYTQDTACRIVCRDGQVIEFGLSIEGVDDEVAEEIQKQTLQRMLPRVKAAIANGSSVRFEGLKPFKGQLPGKALNAFAFAGSGFSVDAEGITEIDSGARVAWGDVADYGVAQEKTGRLPVDVFYIRDTQTQLRTRLGLLANAHVLLALCAEMTGREPGENNAGPGTADR